MLAIIAGLLVMDVGAHVRDTLALAVLGFSLYAALLLWRAAKGDPWSQSSIFIWVDAGWFLLFLLLAGDASPRFFLLLFFPIFFAAWRWGKAESLALASISSLAAIIAIGVANPHVPWAQHLGMPLSLFVVGPLGAILASTEAARQRNRAFSANIVEHIDSRQGFDEILPDVLAQIGVQFNCDAVVMAIRQFDGRSRLLCWEAADGSTELSEAAALPFVERALSLPASAILAFAAKRHWWETERHVGVFPEIRDTILGLVELIEYPRLLSAPVIGPGIGEMRIFLAGDEIETTPPNLDMVAHVMEQITPSVENAYLREQLASEMADAERAKIGRDLHDSAIQPYIGLKFAVEAVQHQAGPKNPLWPELSALAEMATSELVAMREVVSGLRGSPGKGGGLLASAVRRQVSRYSQLFGIRVDLTIDGEMPVSRRIAGEVFHMVAEGLSNIRRHTTARKAGITLCSSDSTLQLFISNDREAGVEPPSFQPRSLTERAQALHGTLKIDHTPSHSIVIIELPLSTTAQTAN